MPRIDIDIHTLHSTGRIWIVWVTVVGRVRIDIDIASDIDIAGNRVPIRTTNTTTNTTIIRIRSRIRHTKRTRRHGLDKGTR